MGNTSFPGVAKSVAVVCTNDGSGSFVKAAEQHGTKVHGPDAVVDLVEADVLARQNMTAVHPATAPPNAAVATDEPDLVVRRVLKRGQAAGIRAWRC